MRIYVLILCLFTAVATQGQRTTKRSVNYTAKGVLIKTVEACGGDTWQQPKTLQLSGNATWTPYGKTDSAHKIYFDTYQMYRVFPAENTAARVANGKVRFDAKYGDSLYMQLIFDSAISRNYLSDRAKPYQKYFSWSNNFGFSIIRFALRDSFKVERLVDDQVEGNDCYIIQITDPKKFVTTFSIDKQTFYIRGVAFITDIGYHHRIYSGFEKLDAGKGRFFIQPKRLRIYFDAIKWMDINWMKNKVNGEIGPEIFKG
jgi:hypothetical protein